MALTIIHLRHHNSNYKHTTGQSRGAGTRTIQVSWHQGNPRELALEQSWWAGTRTIQVSWHKLTRTIQVIWHQENSGELAPAQPTVLDFYETSGSCVICPPYAYAVLKSTRRHTSESKNLPPPRGFLKLFSQRLRIFKQNFTRLLYIFIFI